MVCLNSTMHVRNSRPYLNTRVPKVKLQEKLYGRGIASHYIRACDFSGPASFLVFCAWESYAARR